jgi:hypothetical protein
MLVGKARESDAGSDSGAGSTESGSIPIGCAYLIGIAASSAA